MLNLYASNYKFIRKNSSNQSGHGECEAVKHVVERIVCNPATWAVHYGLWAVRCGLWAVRYGLCIVGCVLWAVGCALWAVGCALWAVGCGLCAVGCVWVCSPSRVSGEPAVPPPCRGASFAFQEAPFEIFPALRTLKERHQILLNSLIIMENRVDFFFPP